MKDLDAIFAIYFAARELPPAERPAYLVQACAGDPALRKRVEQMLDVSAEANAFIPDLPDDVAEERQPGREPLKTLKVELADVPDEAVGQKIGRYKILERVGEGGCGVVYVAEQTEPVRRRVALKVIKLGMDTKQVVARFEAERQALAMMDHPNIAKVLDGGSTEQGRPYFIMELVRGIKITDYCDQANLTTKDRLDLFIKVCHAIQHAHQKGIIHRDIKPSNILVSLNDGVPVPKVIDFGIAKAIEGRLTDATVYTQLHQFIGTPAYMSPEQAEMTSLDIDTRSDIYSLGVLLYELLAGSTPFDTKELMSQGIAAMRKTIREKEPLRPSTKLRQTLVAANVKRLKSSSSDTPGSEEEIRASSRRLLQIKETITRLKGDLDWIVMKCLEKDRARRYDTANGLATDIKRFLNIEPVLARPPSKLYEFQKTVRRHKFGFAAATTIIIVLMAGVLTSTWQAVQATHAKREALAARAQAVKAQANETKLREQAQATELTARQRAYDSDINVAAQAFAGNNLGRARDLLNRQRPLGDQKDLRGWEWRYLWQQTHSDARFTLCQKTEIESLAASADGNWLAIGLVHNDGLFVYDLQTRQEVAHLAPGEGEVRAAFSPVGSLLAYTSVRFPESSKQKNTLRLWNAATLQVVAEFLLDRRCKGLAFTNDGRTLVTSTEVGHITLWRVPDGTKLASYPSEQSGGMDSATDFAATSDLSLAAYGTSSGQVRVMDLHDGKELWSAVAAKQYVTALAFSPDGKTLASAAGFGESDIRLWDVATGKETGRLGGHKGWVGSLVFWPDGKKMASASADQTIRIWDVASRQCLDVLRGHRQEVWRLGLLPDDKTLVSGAKDGTVCLWDTSVTHPHQSRITVPAEVINRCFTSDSSLVTLDSTGQVARWSGPDFQERESVLDAGNHFTDTCFSPDGRFLAGGSANGNLSVWDLSRRVLRHEFKLGDGGVYPKSFLAQGNRLVLLLPAGQRFSEWDLEANREIQSWPASTFTHQGFDVSPNERLVVTVGFNGDVSGRNLSERSNTNLPLDALEGWGVAFSPDGSHLAVPSSLGYVRVWDTATWREEVTLRGFINAVGSVAFSPDVRRLATTGSNAEDAVKLWDVDSWQELLTLEGVGSLFDATAFSPDGNVIATMGSGGILNLWRAPSWVEIHAAEAKEKAESKHP